MTQTDTRNADEIESEIRRTQTDMSRTVDRIGDQMSPRNMFNALLDKADESGVDARFVLDTARRNPLALGLISAGAIWLVSDSDAKPSAFTSNNNGKANTQDFGTAQDYDPDHRCYVEHMARVEQSPDEDELVYQRRRDLARGTFLMIERDHDEDHSSYRKRLDEATDRMREKRDQFADKARDARHRFADTASETADTAANQSRQMVRKGKEAYQENPLLGGLAAALIGAIVGSAVPVSRTEREQLGPKGSETLDRAEEKARELGKQALDKKDELVERADRTMAE